MSCFNGVLGIIFYVLGSARDLHGLIWNYNSSSCDASGDYQKLYRHRLRLTAHSSNKQPILCSEATLCSRCVPQIKSKNLSSFPTGRQRAWCGTHLSSKAKWFSGNSNLFDAKRQGVHGSPPSFINLWELQNGIAWPRLQLFLVGFRSKFTDAK